MSMIEVKTAELSGKALDWAVFCAVFNGMQPTIHKVESVTIERKPFIKPITFPRAVYLTYSGAHGAELDWSPSSSWEQGGPLIEKYGVLLSPPRAMMHVNGGPNAGWRETGTWGSTIFGTERKHRRKAFEHPDQPLVAAMRAIVQFELGDAVSVPEELVHQQGEWGEV